MIQRTNGKCLVLHRGKYRVTYYEDGKRKQKFTGTSDLKKAEIFRDKFLKDATRKQPRYIYKQGSKWLVMVKGYKMGRYPTLEMAEVAKESYMKKMNYEI